MITFTQASFLFFFFLGGCDEAVRFIEYIALRYNGYVQKQTHAMNRTIGLQNQSYIVKPIVVR